MNSSRFHTLNPKKSHYCSLFNNGETHSRAYMCVWNRLTPEHCSVHVQTTHKPLQMFCIVSAFICYGYGITFRLTLLFDLPAYILALLTFGGLAFDIVWRPLRVYRCLICWLLCSFVLCAWCSLANSGPSAIKIRQTKQSGRKGYLRIFLILRIHWNYSNLWKIDLKHCLS